MAVTRSSNSKVKMKDSTILTLRRSARRQGSTGVKAVKETARKVAYMKTASGLEEGGSDPDHVAITIRTKQNKPHAAVDAMFNTFELLESALIDVGAKTLLLPQRVCRQWSAVINSSHVLQQKLFMRPATLAEALYLVGGLDEATDVLYSRPAPSSRFYYRDFLLNYKPSDSYSETQPPVGLLNPLLRMTDIDRGRHNLRRTSFQHQLGNCYPTRDGSWQRMRFINPPQEVFIRIPREPATPSKPCYIPYKASPDFTLGQWESYTQLAYTLKTDWSDVEVHLVGRVTSLAVFFAACDTDDGKQVESS
ncbi:hypothetical protein B0A54_17863 [Friedmanniomyces endolithicus]|uniref:F-box domain-containing protein n=2 Tax=Friedmanniomyces TaxID=329881 RepID=A0A4U0TQ06_9PEZI|nr:hypothetical protein B0A54_17863 [Friedmanniomyces endolithicus]